MLGISINIFIFFVLVALAGFAFFMWREWIYFAKKTPGAALRIGAGLLCAVFTLPLMLLAFAPVLLAAIAGVFTALERRRPALIMAALCMGALIYRLFYGAQTFLP